MTAKLSTTLPPQSHPYLSTFVDVAGQWIVVENPAAGFDLPNVKGKKYKAQLTWDGCEPDVNIEPPPHDRLWIQPNQEGGSGGLAPTYPYQHAYNSSNWFSDPAMEVLLTRDQLRPGAAQLPPDAFIIVDIEHWNLDDSAKTAGIRQLAADIKSLMPQCTLGFYGEAPARDYWTPVHRHIGMKALADYEAGRGENAHDMDGVATRDAVGKWKLDPAKYWNADYTAWQNLNDKRAANLLPAFDVVCPSLYIFYPFDGDATATEHAKAYIRANVEEAVRISGGKPVRVYLSNFLQTPSQPLLAQAEWGVVCDTVAAYPVDVVFWYPTLPRDQWYVDRLKEALTR